MKKRVWENVVSPRKTSAHTLFKESIIFNYSVFTLIIMIVVEDDEKPYMIITVSQGWQSEDGPSSLKCLNHCWGEILQPTTANAFRNRRARWVKTFVKDNGGHYCDVHFCRLNHSGYISTPVGLFPSQPSIFLATELPYGEVLTSGKLIFWSSVVNQRHFEM